MADIAKGICGVLAMQGDYARHCHSLARCGSASLQVRTRDDLAACERLILPGGESTTIYRLLHKSELWPALQQRIQAGMPVFGTCAGMILLAQQVDPDTPVAEPVAGQIPSQHRSSRPLAHVEGLGGIDIAVCRNAYGRQIASFRAELPLTGYSLAKFCAESPALESPLQDIPAQGTERQALVVPLIFIRAPKVLRWGREVQVLLRYQQQAICLQQDKVLVTSFHPELTDSLLLHQYFLRL